MKAKNIILGLLVCIFSNIRAQGLSTVEYMPLSTTTDIQQEYMDTRIHYLNYLDDRDLENFKEIIDKDPYFSLAYLWITYNKESDDENDEALISTAEQLAKNASDSEQAYVRNWRMALNERMKLKKQFQSLKSDEEKASFDWSSISQIQLPILKKLIKMHPKDALLQVDYANTLAFGAQYDEAIKYYKKALQLNDQIYGIYNLLGYLYLDMENYAEAEKQFDTYIKKMPEAANPYDSKGDYYFAIEDYKNALKHYKKAYKIDSDFVISKEKAKEAKNMLRK